MFAVLVPLAIGSLISFGRHRRDCTAELRAAVEAAEFEWIDCRNSGLFDVGPFPKFEFISGGAHTEICGIRGEYTLYRIVRLRDSLGLEHEVWAKLEFEAFRLHHIDWLPTFADLRRRIDAQRDQAF